MLVDPLGIPMELTRARTRSTDFGTHGIALESPVLTRASRHSMQ
jgi:hypothetical protein